MRMLALAVIVGAFGLGNYVSAQDKPAPTPKSVYTSEAMLRRISGSAPFVLDVNNCVLPDKTERAVNATVTVGDRAYRCVEVLDHNFQRRGVAWIVATPQP